MEFEVNTILFLAIVSLGAVVQTITGFAMGLIIMAGVALFALADIAFAAAVVSLISLVNAGVALRQGYRQVELQYLGWIMAGLVPAMAFGLYLLTWLSTHYYEVLKLLLGIVIIAAGTLLMISPSPFAEKSGRVPIFSVGMLGGVLAGLYSAGGAPLAYFMYRQPMEINPIRFTLLSVFAASTGLRLVMIGAAGQLTLDILSMSLVAVPLVVVVTLITTRFVHLVPDRMVRFLVFLVLVISGGVLVLGNLL